MNTAPRTNARDPAPGSPGPILRGHVIVLSVIFQGRVPRLSTAAVAFTSRHRAQGPRPSTSRGISKTRNHGVCAGGKAGDRDGDSGEDRHGPPGEPGEAVRGMRTAAGGRSPRKSRYDLRLARSPAKRGQEKCWGLEQQEEEGQGPLGASRWAAPRARGGSRRPLPLRPHSAAWGRGVREPGEG